MGRIHKLLFVFLHYFYERFVLLKYYYYFAYTVQYKILYTVQHGTIFQSPL